MSRIKVPEGMLKAAIDADPESVEDAVQRIVEAALRWLSENPIVPTNKQALDMWYVYEGIRGAAGTSMAFALIEWQRRMFMAPEAEVLEELADLIVPAGVNIPPSAANRGILEAYRRGKASR